MRNRRHDRPRKDTTRVNGQITAREVRVIAADGEQVGVMPVEQALSFAADQGLDLVEVAPQATPPVCRVLDYSKYRYEQARKQKEARRKNRTVEVRQMKLRPKIADHDYRTKLAHVERFLRKGAKVRVTVMFRGRENTRPELGRQLLDRLAADLAHVCVVEVQPKHEGRDMFMVLTPAGQRA